MARPSFSQMDLQVLEWGVCDWREGDVLLQRAWLEGGRVLTLQYRGLELVLLGGSGWGCCNEQHQISRD